MIAYARNGKLTNVQITSEGEEGKDLLTDAIREEWAKAILESGSATPDAITGATLTFSAGSVQEAMKEILAEMNGEPAETTDAEPVTEAEPEEEKKEEPVTESAAEEVAEAADEPAAETAEETTEEHASEPTDASAASVSVTEQGFGGNVTVHAELNEDGTVKSLTIDTPNETAGLGQRASEAAFTDQFIGKAGPFTFGEDGIEALSGATVTSTAALKAINKAVSGGNTAEAPADEPAEEKQAEPAPETEEKPAEEKAEESAASGGQSYGVYRSTKENSFSKVTVTAAVKNGKLTDVQITSEGEEGKDLLTDEIRGEWAKAILESGSAAPDAITGATLTFSAGSVQEAMTEILEQMAEK